MSESNDAPILGYEVHDSPLVTSDLLRTSDEIDKIAGALAKAQAKIKNPPKNKTATVTMKAGGTYKYNYADLADVIDAVRGPFGENGLALIQPAATPKPGIVVVVTRLIHESGQWLEADLTLGLADDKPQTLGGAITYGRRYSACGMAGISPDADNDATEHDAVTRKDAPQQRAAPQTTQQRKPPPPASPAVQARQAQQRAETGFDPKNNDHANWIERELKKRGVDESLWDDIAVTLTGRPSDALDGVIQSVTKAL